MSKDCIAACREKKLYFKEGLKGRILCCNTVFVLQRFRLRRLGWLAVSQYSRCIVTVG